MWSIAQIAERDGVSKAAVSKAAKKLIEDKPDTPVNRDGQGRIMLLSLAHYDHHRQRHVNPAKAKAEIRAPDQTGEAGGSKEDPSSSFDEARRQTEWLKLGRERIRHQEELGQLLRSDKIDQALRTAGLEIQAVIKRLSNRADELALAVSKEGVHGARVLLRTIAFELGNEIADRLEAVSKTAPRMDDLIGDEVE
ncbi:hypothetical protein PPF1_01 [Rhizobium phage vB_RleM_PPF1]|uniref:hypothetical protein n=1 Tax=Rhizobium phage vB_RleM_PPF1 TaxID=1498228 RepID=UPI00049ABBF4|nr:hypothetical protein PPF1_01 [Rhizobium phage vB_RleM_PPF1]AID18314.1 hypothetical protein PPF1_01 [Rhizobium phage vB_RleM_PPF1]